MQYCGPVILMLMAISVLINCVRGNFLKGSWNELNEQKSDNSFSWHGLTSSHEGIQNAIKGIANRLLESWRKADVEPQREHSELHKFTDDDRSTFMPREYDDTSALKHAINKRMLEKKVKGHSSHNPGNETAFSKSSFYSREDVKMPAFIHMEPEEDLELPSTVWPTNHTVQHKQCMTRITSQHSPTTHGCGSCWAHGSLGGLEIPLCVAGQNTTEESRNGSILFSEENHSHAIQLSVQEILDCTSVDNSTTSPDDGRNHGCAGGEVCTVWNTLMVTGLRTESNFPGAGSGWDANSQQKCASLQSMHHPHLYPAWYNTVGATHTTEYRLGISGEQGASGEGDLVIRQLQGADDAAAANHHRPAHRLKGYVVYPNIRSLVWPADLPDGALWPQNPTQFNEWIKKGVREKGAVVVAMLVTFDHFIPWNDWSSIYIPNERECIGVYDSISGDLVKLTNHNVVVVGYGAEDSVNYFTVRNSWTTAFGVDGYFRVDADYCSKTFKGPLGPGQFFKLPMVPLIEKA